MKKKNFKSPAIKNSGFDAIKGQNEQIKEKFEQAKIQIGISENVILISPDDIDNWEYRDRTESELGNIQELANSIKLKGQAQPIIIVRASKVFKSKSNANSKYVVIAGYRRWLACKLEGLKIKSIIKEVSFEEAIQLLEAENEKESVSDYSKGMFYSRVVESQNITKETLRLKLGLSAGYFSNMLAFSTLPKQLTSIIGDMSNVSCRTASVIRSYLNKNDKYLKICIDNAESIRKGIGSKRLISIFEDADAIVEKKQKHVVFTKNSIKINIKEFSDEQIDKIRASIKEILGE